MVDLTRKYDVLVIGGGNAAQCAAISARRAGASVLVLEGAPKFYRGGNTRHTRNMRCAHDAATDILTGPYTEQEFWDDLLRVTGGETDVCVAATVLAAIDLGFRVVLPTDALCSASDATHDALMTLYRRRFSHQIETTSTERVLREWQ